MTGCQAAGQPPHVMLHFVLSPVLSTGLFKGIRVPFSRQGVCSNLYVSWYIVPNVTTVEGYE
jgi:hypothetical protein